MAYADEEEALSFNVWVAELELLVGNARGNRRVDPIYSFELLQKLQGSIQRSDRAQLHSYQRKCEDALTTVLLKGAPPPVTLSAQGSVMCQRRSSLLIASKHGLISWLTCDSWTHTGTSAGGSVLGELIHPGGHPATVFTH